MATVQELIDEQRAIEQAQKPSPTPSFSLEPQGPPITAASPESQLANASKFLQGAPPATGRFVPPGADPSAPRGVTATQRPRRTGAPEEIQPEVDPQLLAEIEVLDFNIPEAEGPTRTYARPVRTTPKSPSLWKQTKKAWRRSGKNIDLDFMYHKAAMLSGEARLKAEEEANVAAAEFQKRSQADPVKGRNWAQNLFLKTVGVARPMAAGTARGAAVGTAAGTTAAVAGQLGPQVAFPEEIVTVPGAFAAGTVVGSVDYWGRQGSGAIYRQAREQKLSPEVAGYAAAAGGPLYAFIEFSQVDKLIPGIGKLKRSLLQKAFKIGITAAQEIGEEGAQRVVTDGSVNIAKAIEGQIGASDVPEVAKKMALDAWIEMKEAAGPLTVLGLGSASVSAAAGALSGQQAVAPTEADIVDQAIPTERQTPEAATEVRSKISGAVGEAKALGVDFRIRLEPDQISLDRVQRDRSDISTKGNGAEAIRKLQEVARGVQLPIILSVGADFGAEKSLIAYYENLGFVADKPIDLSTTMRWTPDDFAAEADQAEAEAKDEVIDSDVAAGQKIAQEQGVKDLSLDELRTQAQAIRAALKKNEGQEGAEELAADLDAIDAEITELEAEDAVERAEAIAKQTGGEQFVKRSLANLRASTPENLAEATAELNESIANAEKQGVVVPDEAPTEPTITPKKPAEAEKPPVTPAKPSEITPPPLIAEQPTAQPAIEEPPPAVREEVVAEKPEPTEPLVVEEKALAGMTKEEAVVHILKREASTLRQQGKDVIAENFERAAKAFTDPALKAEVRKGMRIEIERAEAEHKQAVEAVAEAPINVYKTTDGEKTGIQEEEVRLKDGVLVDKASEEPVVLDVEASGSALAPEAQPITKAKPAVKAETQADFLNRRIEEVVKPLRERTEKLQSQILDAETEDRRFDLILKRANKGQRLLVGEYNSVQRAINKAHSRDFELELQQEFKKQKSAKPAAPKKPRGPGGAAGASAAVVSSTSGRGYGTIAAKEKNKFAETTNKKSFRDAAPSTSQLKPVDELLKVVAPAAREGVAREGARVLRKNLGQLAQESVVAHESLKKAHRAFTFMSRDDIYDFIDRMETGRQQTTPRLQGAAKRFRELLDQRRDAVRALGKGHLESFYENYFPHIWKDPSSAQKVIQQIFGKRRFAGSKSFLKKRTIMTVKEGRDAGLELQSENPVDLVLLKVYEMDRYLMAQRTILDLKERSLIKFVYSRMKSPDGYVKIDDNAFTVYMPPEITKKEAYDQLLVDQMLEISRSLGIDAQRFTVIGGQRWGFAQWDKGKPSEAKKVRTKFAGPESVLAHEIGHILGARYSLYDTLRRKEEGSERTITRGAKKGQVKFVPTKDAIEHRKKIDVEWRALADARFKDVGATPGYQRYVRNAREKEAVMLEALIHAPKEFKRVAPTLHDLFVKFLNSRSELRPILDIQPSLVLGSADAVINIPGFTTLGHYYAPEPVGKILNNFLSPGLRNSENQLVAGGYNLLRMSGNLLNQAQLALSGFHALNVTTDMMASTFGLGLRQLTVEGQRLQGLGNILTAPVSPIARIWSGVRLRRAYKQQIDTIQDDRLRNLVKAIVQADGRDRMDPFYYNQAIKALTKTTADIFKGSPKQKIKGAFKLPMQTFGAALELAAKPLMEWYVPTGKLGLFSIMAQHEMQRAEAGQITDEQLHERLISSWDSVDNRMGQLVYDNLFWNKTFKDIAMMSVRSVGWNLGSWREFGGTPIDILGTRGRLSRGDVILSQKMAYTIGAIVLYGTLGAAIMYLLTGEGPEEPKDYFFPKTGGTNSDGSDERLSLPTYAKDWWAYGTRPAQTLKNKLHPLWGLMTDVIKNKDFFNVQVRDPKDPISQQMLDTAEHIGREFLPLSARNYQKMSRSRPGQTGKNVWVSMTGITSAPSYITRTPAQKLMYRYIIENIPDKTRTREAGELAQYRREVKNRLRKGDPVDQREAVKRLGLTSWKRLKTDAAKEPFAESFSRLSLHQALNVFLIADSTERTKVASVLSGKWTRATKKTPEMTDLYKQIVESVQQAREKTNP